MECDEEIDYECDVCPHCGIDCPVTYRWYNEYYLPKVDDAKAKNDLDKLANLYLKAFIEAGSLPDLVVLGDMARALEEIYLELGYHERLIWLYIEDATTFTYEGCWIDQAPRKAYLHARKVKRPDLELYVMEVFDAENARLHQSKESQTPLDLVDRKQELVALRDAGEINSVEFPGLSEDMWIDFDSLKKGLGFLSSDLDSN